jgi:hypothetical protein
MSGVVLVSVYPVAVPVHSGSIQVVVIVELVVTNLGVFLTVTRAIFAQVVVKIFLTFVVPQVPTSTVFHVLLTTANHPTVAIQHLLAWAYVVLPQHVKE